MIKDVNRAQEVLLVDPIMTNLVKSHSPPHIGQNSIFFSLVRAIISQRLSEKAASMILKRLSGKTAIQPENLAVLNLDAFRLCGISLPKAQYIMDIAKVALSGKIDFIDSLDDEEAIQALLQLKGVGRWTAEMVLIFSLGRENIWPCNDAGLLRAAKNLYCVTGVNEFRALGDKFVPFRSHAAWYLWSSLDNVSRSN